MTIDYTRINNATEHVRCPIPTFEELHRKMGTKKCFSKFDLKSGFFQIPMAEEDRPKTAFWWGKVLYMFTCMPMGLKFASKIPVSNGRRINSRRTRRRSRSIHG